jgi:phosphatidylserine/phosphatidylglycerophosphate/cardiolipin synthase-like enzyme
VQIPGGNPAAVHPAALDKDVPEPFKSAPTGGAGVRMHHKFVVLDFDQPTARVYLGSYNFSGEADTKNGENLVLVRDRRVAVSYMVEALTMFDHYHFRLVEQENAKAKPKPAAGAKPEGKPAVRKLELHVAPKTSKDTAWWEEDYTDPMKIRDRKMFA